MLKHKLMFIPTAEGYVSAVYPESITSGDPPKFAYVTNIRDHLGNLRMSLTRDNNRAVILQERHYYPFGLLHRGYNEEKHEIQYTEAEEDKIFTPQTVAGHYKYLYQEQERQVDLNLNWDSFKYRNYDYTIGRFMSVDPLAEKYPYNSTYAFSENKVTAHVELEGLESLWYGYRGLSPEKIYEINHTVSKTSGKILTFFVRTFTPVEEAYAIVTGKDFDGNSYNRALAAVFAAPWGKIAKAGKEFKMIFNLAKGIKTADHVAGLQKMGYKIGADGVWKGGSAFRHNLKKFTKFDAPSDVQAHHIFPQNKKFREFFEKQGIDVNNPMFGKWMKEGEHIGKFSKKYDALWKKFIGDSKGQKFTVEQLLNKAEEFEKKALEYANQ